MSEISSFTGQYRFLSNFYIHGMKLGPFLFPSVEHAYQAAKTNVQKDWYKFAMDVHGICVSPSEAKRMGRKLVLRPDWEDVKLQVMEELLRIKFTDKELNKQLINTGNTVLIEENTWGDTFWGECNGTGHNHLGKLLMKIRDEPRS